MNAPHKLTMAEYIDHRAVSSGMLHTLLAQSPYHAWFDSPFNPKRPREDSGTMDIGTYAHACLLEGGCTNLVVVEADDWRTKAAREARDNARATGRLPILAQKLPEVALMVERAQAYIAASEIRGVFDSGVAEQTILFEECGVECKARPDWLTADHRICLSYKTTAGSANPDAWIRNQLPSYDLATVFYESAVLSLAPDADVRTVHLVQEQCEPYSCALVSLGPAFRELACRKFDMALKQWRDCAERGKWPAYPTRIAYAEPKPWQIAEVDEWEYRALPEIDPLQQRIGIQA